jgi:hypothetical protein
VACIKTGFHAYSHSYGTFLRGDAYKLKDVYIFRIIDESYKPIFDTVNFVLYEENSNSIRFTESSNPEKKTLIILKDGVDWHTKEKTPDGGLLISVFYKKGEENA